MLKMNSGSNLTASDILIIDDEEKMCLSLKELLEKADFTVDVAFSVKEAFQLVEENEYNLLICDIRMPGMGGMSLLEKVGKKTPVIMMTAYASVETARHAFKLGARDYVTKPFKFDELLVMIRQFIAEKQPKGIFSSSEMLLQSQDESFIKICELARKFSSTDIPILITGESGCGKEVIADYIYSLNKRKNVPYVKINCAAIPDTLLEGELFGYEKGAFTGAIERKIGKIEEADGGILFLDEIGDMPLVLQSKMLRILQDFTFTRLGSTREHSVHTRIITASNQDIDMLVKEGRFRLDLYYRLRGLYLKLPPLRERLCDIEVLSYFFLNKFNAKYNKQIQRIDGNVFDVFREYPWPGNIRELKYAIERAVIVCDGAVLLLEHLPDSIYAPPRELKETGENSKQSFSKNVEQYRDEYMRKCILEALQKTNGNKVETAKLLHISRKTLYNKIKELHIKYEFV